MWAKPVNVWLVHGVFAGGGAYMVFCSDIQYRAAVFVVLMLIRFGWTWLILRHAADAKFQAVVQRARQRSAR